MNSLLAHAKPNYLFYGKEKNISPYQNFGVPPYSSEDLHRHITLIIIGDHEHDEAGLALDPILAKTAKKQPILFIRAHSLKDLKVDLAAIARDFKGAAIQNILFIAHGSSYEAKNGLPDRIYLSLGDEKIRLSDQDYQSFEDSPFYVLKDFWHKDLHIHLIVCHVFNSKKESVIRSRVELLKKFFGVSSFSLYAHDNLVNSSSDYVNLMGESKKENSEKELAAQEIKKYRDEEKDKVIFETWLRKSSLRSLPMALISLLIGMSDIKSALFFLVTTTSLVFAGHASLFYLFAEDYEPHLEDRKNNGFLVIVEDETIRLYDILGINIFSSRFLTENFKPFLTSTPL